MAFIKIVEMHQVDLKSINMKKHGFMKALSDIMKEFDCQKYLQINAEMSSIND